jgi:PAS domain S-box-containing protein
MLDPAGIVVTWNADAERITGYCAEEIIGTHFSRLYTDADRQIGAPEAALEKAASEGRFEDEGWRVGKDGKRLWAHVILDRIQNETGEITGFAKIAWHFMEHTVTDKQIDPTDPKPINISGLIEDMEDVIQRTAGVAIQVETVAADRLWNTMVDRNQFEATVMNLCIDAREAMRAGGHLTIETANTWLDERAPQECDAKLGQFVTLSFSDTGTGTLVDRKFAGTGLALSGIDAFARQSGGYMRVEAGPGKRRKVCLHLPRHNGVRTVGKPAVGCSRILLVDDNLDVVVTTAAFMENAGYWVIRATSADQALGFLAAGERFDVLVSDYAMPGMHGLDLIEQARMIQPGLAALLITGFAGAIDPALLPAGVEILAKPFRQRQLVDAVLDASMRVQVEPEPATIKV